jgi:fructoselysine-6-P-deglycase FrlB-like protein
MAGEPETVSALVAIHAEMARQAQDARASFLRNANPAGAAAASLRRTRRALLLGMGGSHAVNRVAEALYREAGIDATAHPVSEMLSAPIPLRSGTVLLTSQSGESGEIVRHLALHTAAKERFGLTLDAASTLARSVPSLIGYGGPERAFAATRSLYVSLALHARILHELGVRQDDALAATSRPASGDIGAVADALASAGAVILSGRGVMQGLAEAAALGLLELARMPSFALDGGQLRHGPLEALGPAIGVVFIRAAGAADSTPDLARICVEAGSPTVLVDASGLPPPAGVDTLAAPPCSGMGAALTLLPTLQALIIAIAQRRVVDVGAPLRSTKVTVET